MNIDLNNTDNNDYVRGYKDGKKAGIAAEYYRAQVLVDALEKALAKMKECEEVYNVPCGFVMELCEKTLKQWEGKEVGDEICGICKDKPMGDGLTVCNECYEKFDGDRRGFWKGDVYQ